MLWASGIGVTMRPLLTALGFLISTPKASWDGADVLLGRGACLPEVSHASQMSRSSRLGTCPLVAFLPALNPRARKTIPDTTKRKPNTAGIQNETGPSCLRNACIRNMMPSMICEKPIA